ncbi:MAG: leucine-rich repeat protein, partial [Clostridia bacterium]|nr:leucine-rich repeat protein [Clostridia bacterium]
KPMRLNVTFYTRYDADGNWLQGRSFVKDFVKPDETLKSGGSVELPSFKEGANSYYIFNGWQIGDQVTNASSQQLDTKVLSQLETVVKEDAEGLILHVHIYAAQTKRTLNVNYNFMVGNIDLRENRSIADFVTVLPQGSLFYDYYPFSVARTDGDYTAFDTRGKQFKSWSYSINGSSFIAIDANTRVPSGVSQIMIVGGFTGDKKFEVAYHDKTGELLCQDTNDRNYYNYDSSNFQLKNYIDVQIAQVNSEWGTFVGWSVEPDFKSGNPEVIYDVHYYVLEHKTSSNPNPHPLLHLTNQMDTICSPYKIDIDRYAIQEDGLIYTLHLYAVYANDSVNINYANKSNANLKIPLYSSNDYTHATIGGCTVGYNSNDFIVQGVTVLDDYSVGLSNDWNFVGWKIVQLENVSQKIQEQFADRIWFSGDYLPSIDFSFNFSLQYVEKDNLIHKVTVGTKTYQILSLSNGIDKVVVDCSSGIVKIGSTTIPCPDGVDIVVLPRGDYTVGQGNIVINSTREVHVVVPSVGNIVLEPRAIQCNTIKEFYVPENVTITGSPVVGDNFQAYHVQKGYRLLNNDGSISGVLNASTKYNFAASLKGLLVSLDGTTLYGVPSHTNLTTAELLAFINESITEIVPYALSDINSLRTLSLAKNSNLQIDELAIFNGTMRNIILPAGNALSGLEINSQALAGALTDLISVTFGDANTTATWYAFVDGDFVYYLDNLAVTDAKTHVMYALRSVKLNNLTYHNLDTVTNNLTIADTVTKIEPYALAGLNWTQIHSVTANNVNVDLRFLKGIATDIPLFTDKDNPHKGPMIQPYLKTFRFVYKEGLEEASVYTVEFAYGQTFRVFNAQSNNYGFKFNRAWSQFQGWKIGNNNQRIDVGRIFKVGMDELVLGDKYTVQFNASSDDCWKQYLIQFQTFNDEFSANDFKFEGFDGKKYAISDLKDNNLGNIYLPAVDQNITVGGVVYQFIGWSTTKRGASGATPNLWNNVDQKLRVLPNRTTSAVLNKGTRVGGVYVYYALYEPVTPNLHYDPLDANGSDLEDTDTNVSTYAVSAPIQFNATSINIPFAHFNAGYMVPISTVRNFNISTNTALTEIVIGAAVSKIDAAAFQNVRAMQIKFNHKGRKIYYNSSSNTNWLELTIGANAFANNAALENVVLPAAVVTLGDSAFRACNNLYSVTFEAADSLAICNLGDFVFRDDTNLTNNALVGLLAADSNKERFGAVGNGIFMHTKVDSVDNSHKIVWGDTLLHVHYDNGSTEYTFSEKIIAGYAFADLGSSTANNIVIKFTNSGVRIKAKAFSFLHNSVSTIRLDTAAGIQPSNVDAHAFDDLTDHNVAVYTPNLSAWNKDFSVSKGTISNNITIHGSN